jgi:hypothetical protein
VGLGLYKYTFNKLNSGLGLIGKRLIKIINEKSKNLFLELFAKKTWLDSFILPTVYTKVSF